MNAGSSRWVVAVIGPQFPMTVATKAKVDGTADVIRKPPVAWPASHGAIKIPPFD